MTEAAPITPPATPPAAAPLAAVPDWTSSLPEEAKGYVQNKGWKDPNGVLESYRNLEKLHGVPPELIIKLPKDAADKAGWDAVQQRLGRPEKADGYNIPVPEKGGDPAFAKWAKDQLFEQGIPAKAGENLVAKFNEYIAGQQKAVTDAANVERTNQANALKKEWGSAHDHEIGVAKRACQTFGVDAATVDKIENAIGFEGVMKLFNKIGKGLGEDKFVSGGAADGNRPLTPEAAGAKLKALQADKVWSGRYLSGDADACAEATRLLTAMDPHQE